MFVSLELVTVMFWVAEKGNQIIVLRLLSQRVMLLMITLTGISLSVWVGTFVTLELICEMCWVAGLGTK